VKAILIDAVNQEVKEVDVDTTGKGENLCHNIDQMYELIGCSCFTTGGKLPNGDVLYVDDEGLLTGPEHFFMWQGYPAPLAGNGLLCGSGSMGQSAPVKSDLEEIRDGVTFLNLFEAALIAKVGGF
jgi:hypothetical protein